MPPPDIPPGQEHKLAGKRAVLLGLTVTEPRGRQSYFGDVFPIPPPPPPVDFQWPPVYSLKPLIPPIIPAFPSFFFSWPITLPEIVQEWYPVLQQVIARPKFSKTSSSWLFEVLGTQQAIPKLGWQTFAFRGMKWTPKDPRETTANPLSVPIPSPPTIPVACIEWTAEDVIRPLLDEETFRRPNMGCTTETNIVEDEAFLLAEDGGFLLLEAGGQIILEDSIASPCETFVRPMLIEENWC